MHDSAAAITFYCKMFGVTEKFRLTEPSGRIGHAERAPRPYTDHFSTSLAGPMQS